MKRTSILLGPPLAFVLAAVVAWLAGPPVGKAVSPGGVDFRSPRQRAARSESQSGPAAVAVQFEREMINYRAPAKKVHDAEGMEAALKSDEKTSGIVHGGNYAMTYSIEWTEKSPAEMFAWLIHEGGSDFKNRVKAASILFEAWARTDMETALAAISKIPDTGLRRQALASSLEVLCQTDPNRARELMMRDIGLFSPDSGGSLFNPHGTGRTNCELLLSLPPGVERTHLLADLLTGMAHRGGDDAADAASVWRAAPEPVRREWIAAGFTSDRENAASFDGLEDFTREQLETSPDPRAADYFMAVYGPGWATRDLAGALDWVREHLKGKIRMDGSVGLFEPAAGQDLDTTLEVWQTLPEGNLKDRAAEAISKGAPPDRKAEAEEVLRAASEGGRIY